VHSRLWKAPAEVFQWIWRAQYQAESVLKNGGWLCEMLFTPDILLFKRSCLSFLFPSYNQRVSHEKNNIKKIMPVLYVG
jgi:hypothetical protein